MCYVITIVISGPTCSREVSISGTLTSKHGKPVVEGKRTRGRDVRDKMTDKGTQTKNAR